MYKILQRMMLAVCRFSLRRPGFVLLLAAIVSVPALIEVQRITIDPNIVRLLPGHSRAAQNTRELAAVTGDGGYFTVMISSEETNRLVPAADAAAARIRKLPGVHAVEYQWPVEFFRKYRYLLIPNTYIDDLYEKVVGWKSELSPAGDNLLSETRKPEGAAESAQSAEEGGMEGDIRQFATLSRHHLSVDGKTLGLVIRTKDGIAELQQVVALFDKLTNVTAAIAREFRVETGVAGSHRNKIDEYNVINGGLGLSTIISGGLILLVTIIGFRSFRKPVIVLLPLLVGMLWGFSLIPVTVKSLNLITSFLMLILTGMGIDYAIHLVKRIEQELVDKPFDEALIATYRNTGPSVLVSGFTTALALFILAISDCKGFSEFGIIAAMVLVSIMLAMAVLMPAVIVLGHRFGWLEARDHRNAKAPVLSRRATLVSLAVCGVCLVIAATSLRFDASFRNLQFDRSKIKGLEEAKASQSKVYSSSMSPGAIFIARDIDALDRLIAVFDKRIREKTYLSPDGKTNTTTIKFVRSLRDFAPRPGSLVWNERLQGLRNIREEMHEGNWIDKITNPDRKRWLSEMRDWSAGKNPRPAAIGELPDLITSAMLSKDGAGQYLLSVFPAIDRKSAGNAIRFTKEIYALVPADQAAREKAGLGGIQGPVGETPIFAELVEIVKGEVGWLVLLTFAGVFFLVYLELFSFRESLFVMLPLIFGLVLIFGLMPLLGMDLNLFNVVMIPALLGMGVDNGVHLYTRWKEHMGETARTAGELFTPLFLCTFTTMLGYIGMIFVDHPGLRSVGWLAFFGMMLLWVTSAIMLPGMLENFGRKTGLLRRLPAAAGVTADGAAVAVGARRDVVPGARPAAQAPAGKRAPRKSAPVKKTAADGPAAAKKRVAKKTATGKAAPKRDARKKT